MEFGNEGKLNAALTTGIIGTAGVGLGLLGSLLGGNNQPAAPVVAPSVTVQSAAVPESTPVSRYELGLIQQIETERSKNALLEANIYGDQKLLEVYKYIDGKLDGVHASINQQAVINAQVAANLSCMQNTINTLSGLTKTVIPITSICPEPMRRYNSWTAPTETADGT